MALDIALDTAEGAVLADEVQRHGGVIAAPEIIELEFLQALWRLGNLKRGEPARLTAAVANFEALEIECYSHAALRDRVWQLRAKLTAYDEA